MSTVYLLSEKTVARKEHGRMILETEDGGRRGIPFRDIEQVVLSRRAHISMPLMFALLEQGISLSFINGRGEPVASMGGDSMTIKRIFRQRDKFENENTNLQLIRELVCEKLRGQEQLVKSYAKRKKEPVLFQAAAEIARYRKQAENLEDMEELRGCEGIAARTYFQTFSKILDPVLWPWNGRSRRPAQDPVNALLNLGYAFLEREVRIAVVGARLDPRIGFMHANNGRGDRLVFDFMEYFRAGITDRFVLKLLNLGTLSVEDFKYTEEDGSRLTETAFPVWCTAHEEYMTKPVSAYDGRTPRDEIRKKIHDFADTLFTAI